MGDQVLCDECKDEFAAMFCAACNAVQCQRCSEFLHNEISDNTSHTVVSLVPAAAPCGECQDEPAVLMCAACDAMHCRDCSEYLHSHVPSNKDHDVVAISSSSPVAVPPSAAISHVIPDDAIPTDPIELTASIVSALRKSTGSDADGGNTIIESIDRLLLALPALLAKTTGVDIVKVNTVVCQCLVYSFGKRLSLWPSFFSVIDSLLEMTKSFPKETTYVLQAVLKGFVKQPTTAKKIEEYSNVQICYENISKTNRVKFDASKKKKLAREALSIILAVTAKVGISAPCMRTLCDFFHELCPQKTQELYSAAITSLDRALKKNNKQKKKDKPHEEKKEEEKKTHHQEDEDEDEEEEEEEEEEEGEDVPLTNLFKWMVTESESTGGDTTRQALSMPFEYTSSSLIGAVEQWKNWFESPEWVSTWRLEERIDCLTDARAALDTASDRIHVLVRSDDGDGDLEDDEKNATVVDQKELEALIKDRDLARRQVVKCLKDLHDSAQRSDFQDAIEACDEHEMLLSQSLRMCRSHPLHSSSSSTKESGACQEDVEDVEPSTVISTWETLQQKVRNYGMNEVQAVADARIRLGDVVSDIGRALCATAVPVNEPLALQLSLEQAVRAKKSALKTLDSVTRNGNTFVRDQLTALVASLDCAFTYMQKRTAQRAALLRVALPVWEKTGEDRHQLLSLADTQSALLLQLDAVAMEKENICEQIEEFELKLRKLERKKQSCLKKNDDQAVEECVRRCDELKAQVLASEHKKRSLHEDYATKITNAVTFAAQNAPEAFAVRIAKHGGVGFGLWRMYTTDMRECLFTQGLRQKTVTSLQDEFDGELVVLYVSGRHRILKGTRDGTSYALKEYKLDNRRAIKRFKRETSILHRLNCPNTVSVNCVYYMDPMSAYLEMPYYDGGSLNHWLQQNPEKRSDLVKCQAILGCIVRGLADLHNTGIVHCDIKPDNVFMTRDDQPKIGDFDVSKDSSERSNDVSTFLAQTITQTQVGDEKAAGTLAFMAPELFPSGPTTTAVSKGATNASDVYALGVLSITLMCGLDVAYPSAQPSGGPSLPSNPENFVRQQLSKGWKFEDKYKDIFLHQIAQLIGSMLARDPDKRPTAHQLLTHPFLNSSFLANLTREVLKVKDELEHKHADLEQKHTDLQAVQQQLEEERQRVDQENEKNEQEFMDAQRRIEDARKTLDEERRALAAEEKKHFIQQQKQQAELERKREAAESTISQSQDQRNALEQQARRQQEKQAASEARIQEKTKKLQELEAAVAAREKDCFRRRTDGNKEIAKQKREMREKEARIEKEKAAALKRDPFQPPSYWTSRSSLANGKGKGRGAMAKVDETRKRKADIQALIDRNCHPPDLGKGRDVQAPGRYSGFQVMKVERIEHPDLWARFNTERTLLETRLANSKGKLQTAHVHTHSKKIWSELHVHGPQANESLLFHGTNCANTITEQGFDERVGSLTGLFGSGIYFAEDIAKVDQYCKPCPSNNCITVFVTRVLMGNYAVVEQTRNGCRRPPCIDKRCEDERCSHSRVDSIIANSQRHQKKNNKPVTAYLARHREFVVYNGHRCYPELLLTLKRV